MLKARHCEVCGSDFVADGWPICPLCLHELPLTGAWRDPTDPFRAGMLGSIPELEGFYPLCYFTKGSSIRHLVHRLKYQGRQDLALHLGHFLGQQLRENPACQDIHAIVPLPLHWYRQLWRGYNQSQLLATGIARALGVPVQQLLRRHRRTRPQALHRDREARMGNVALAFRLSGDGPLPQGGHLLLVDDVVTTGSTARAAIRELRAIPGIKISLACLGVVKSFLEPKR